MSATPATRALDAAGVAYRLHPYHHDPASRRFGEEAAAALGVDPEQIFKTLLVDAGGTRPDLAVAVVPVAAMLDLKAMAEALGVRKLAMAEPATAERVTGYLVGGISPLGQKVRLPCLVDETAQLFDTVFVSAGRRGLQVELAPDGLVAVLGAGYADIAR